MIFNDDFRNYLDKNIPKEYLEEADKQMRESQNYGIQTKYILALEIFYEKYKDLQEDRKYLEEKISLSRKQNDELLNRLARLTATMQDILHNINILLN